MTNEQYIEHEVNLRVHSYKFSTLERELHKLDNKITGLYGLIIGSIVIPMVLHYFELI